VNVDQWRQWLAPPVQLFFVPSLNGWPASVDAVEVTRELVDTFRLWRPEFRDKQPLWLDEATFFALPARRQAQLRRTRPTVWPSEATDAVVRAFVESENERSEHRAVTAWRLPRAKQLAGTFPPGSGPNCFGGVMGAAGVVGAEQEQMLQEPFEDWLHTNARRGGDDVMVWRDSETRLPFHAAITLGDGWVFEKPSQCWWTHWQVVTADTVKRTTRMRGLRLERWRLT
jgi:hypothetical protein